MGKLIIATIIAWAKALYTLTVKCLTGLYPPLRFPIILSLLCMIKRGSTFQAFDRIEISDVKSS